MTDSQKLHAGNEMDKQGGPDEDVKYDFDINLDENDLSRMSPESAENSFDFAASSEASKEPDFQPFDMADSSNEERELPKKSNMKLFIIIGVLAGLIVLGLFVYFAMAVLGGGSKPAAVSGSNGQQQPVAVNDLSLTSSPTGAAGVGFPSQSSQVDVMDLDAALNGTNSASRGEVVNGGLVNELKAGGGAASLADKNIVITYGADSFEQAPLTQETQQVAVPVNDVKGVTDEERLYDSLLSSVDGMDVPPEAIKIDQAVISRKLESQRLGALESDVKAARDSIASMSGAVEGIRAQVADFAKIVEKNTEDQAAVTASISQLTEELKKVSENHSKEIKALRDSVAKVQSRADQASAQAREAKKVAQTPQQATPRQAVVATAPAKEAPVAVPSQVLAPTPTPPTVHAPVAERAKEPSGPAQCDGTKVSSIWRVKGVNNHSAYIVRSQDQEGLYLKLGIEVPGYGQVISFDASNRSVCTTAGLIRR
ncbi:hypothetical protein [Stutzerimonas stutzeri]|uniref:hypothetical protein n=1 Tax=Stutzerimonas stutzeri TaxID=316 RepID=UPI00265D513C|nr:hypothetical protein [Stutzerimonas stutzeri]MCF6783418.1 hypothetical protein [Stutzerimonas stutzeri]